MAKDLKIIRRNKDVVIRFRERNAQFVINWIELLDWDGDPFQNKIFHPEEDFIAGYAEQRKKLNLFLLRDQRVATIFAEPGMGKTQLLSWMDYELSFDKQAVTKFLKAGKASLQTFKRKLIYPLLPTKDRFLCFLYFKMGFRKLPKFLSQEVFKESWLRWIPRWYVHTFNKPFIALETEKFVTIMDGYLGNRKYVLMLDDAADLSADAVAFIQMLLAEGLPFHVVAADTKTRWKGSPWKKTKQDITIHLEKMGYDELKDMIEKRIESFNGAGTYPLVESQLKEIFRKGEYNPQKVLQLARDVVIQFVVERVRKKQDPKVAQPGIPNLKLKEGGGVHVEKEQVRMLPPDQQKALSEYERKAQRSLLRLSKEFSSEKPIETYYDEQREKEEKKEAKKAKKKQNFTKEKVTFKQPKKRLTQKEMETEDALAALSREFSRKGR